MIKDISKVETKKIIKLCEILKQNNYKEASFEFIIGSLFPKAYENIKEELRRQYTLGYAAGLEENKTPN